jgi:hypothetical protein
MPRKSPCSDKPIELRNLPRFDDVLEDVMGVFVEKMIAVAMAEARHLVDEALLGLRTAAVLRRDRAVNADDRHRFEQAVHEFDEGLRQRGQRHSLSSDPLFSQLDHALEVVVDEWSARVAADGTYFSCRVLAGLEQAAQDLRLRADNAVDRTRFDKAQREVEDTIQRIGNSWDGRQGALDIIVEEFSIEAITHQADFVLEILRELRRTARLRCESPMIILATA